jgi:AFG3 family protein
MSKKLGYGNFDRNNGYSQQKFSEKTNELIDSEMQALIEECTAKTRKIIKKHKQVLLNLSNALLKKETLNLNDIIDILGERPFKPSK